MTKIFDLDLVLNGLSNSGYVSGLGTGIKLEDDERFATLKQMFLGENTLIQLPKEAAPVINVFDELRRAEEIHPDYPNNGFEALAIVTEEHGELAQAMLKFKHEGGDPEQIRVEAIQLAAMAIRMVMNLPIIAKGKNE